MVIPAKAQNVSLHTGDALTKANRSEKETDCFTNPRSELICRSALEFEESANFTDYNEHWTLWK
jgi:hypothetical protein